jgi:hypothetical protein
MKFTLGLTAGKPGSYTSLRVVRRRSAPRASYTRQCLGEEYVQKTVFNRYLSATGKITLYRACERGRNFRITLGTMELSNVKLTDSPRSDKSWYRRSFYQVLNSARLIREELSKGGERWAQYSFVIKFACRLLNVQARLDEHGEVWWHLPKNSARYLRAAGLDPDTLEIVDRDRALAAWYQLLETSRFWPSRVGEYLEKVGRGEVTGKNPRLEWALARRARMAAARKAALGSVGCRMPGSQPVSYEADALSIHERISARMRMNRQK